MTRICANPKKHHSKGQDLPDWKLNYNPPGSEPTYCIECNVRQVIDHSFEKHQAKVQSLPGPFSFSKLGNIQGDVHNDCFKFIEDFRQTVLRSQDENKPKGLAEKIESLKTAARNYIKLRIDKIRPNPEEVPNPFMRNPQPAPVARMASAPNSNTVSPFATPSPGLPPVLDGAASRVPFSQTESLPPPRFSAADAHSSQPSAPQSTLTVPDTAAHCPPLKPLTQPLIRTDACEPPSDVDIPMGEEPYESAIATPPISRQLQIIATDFAALPTESHKKLERDCGMKEMVDHLLREVNNEKALDRLKQNRASLERDIKKSEEDINTKKRDLREMELKIEEQEGNPRKKFKGA